MYDALSKVFGHEAINDRIEGAVTRIQYFSERFKDNHAEAVIYSYKNMKHPKDEIR